MYRQNMHGQIQIIKLPPVIGTPNMNLNDMLVYIPIFVFSPYGGLERLCHA
jgi:hypothetical protein